MLAIISPAKRLDFESPVGTKKFSTPDFVKESTELIKTLRQFEPAQISSLMKLSDKLGELNHRRYHEWRPTFDAEHTRPAILAFQGDVYVGLDGPSLSERDYTWAQKHLRILSGLHGLLRPMDRIHPYRLEMGARLTTKRGNNLYEFWGDKVTDALNQAIAEQKQKVLINLASNEYYSVIRPEKVDARIINIQFKEHKDGKLKIISFYAKKARGLMARYMILNRAKSVDALKAFNYEGYRFDPALSDDENWLFTRKSN